MLSEDERDDLIADNNFQHGRDYERERIIALLEGMVGNMDGNYSSPKEVYGAVLDAIALIKGENK
jgi:hypothetical protein